MAGSLLLVLVALTVTAPVVLTAKASQEQPRPAESVVPPGDPVPAYVIGPGDVIAIKALDAEEISQTSLRIDPSGVISLPLIGRIHASGLTIHQLEHELAARLKVYVREPLVAVSIVEYRSQPVSVIGAVAQPGVHQLEGPKTLVETLAQAGGLRQEAGNIVKITRKIEWGPIPLASAVKDPTGQFTVAEVSLAGIMRATNPEENIRILPHDVVSVPRAALVYVIGEVKKPGGFVLQDRETVSGLQALAMAEGFTSSAARDKAVIIRTAANAQRIEIAANLRDILNGKQRDIELQPDDILVVPTNVGRTALGRTIQTAIQAAASALIYRGFY